MESKWEQTQAHKHPTPESIQMYNTLKYIILIMKILMAIEHLARNAVGDSHHQI